MDDERTIGSGGDGNGVTTDRRELSKTILELAAFGERVKAFAERLYETTGDGTSAEFLIGAKQLGEFILSAGDLRADLRWRAMKRK